MSKKLPGMPAVRDLFREESSGKIFRVIYAKRRGASDWNETEVVLCNIFGSHLDIEFVSLHQFYTRCMPEYEGEDRLTYVKPADDPYGRLRKIHWDTPANEEKSIENWKRIEGLVDDEKLFYRTLSSGTDRKNILQDFADDAGVSLQRIRRLHRLYLQRGMNRNAVAGELWRCGRLNQPPRYVDGENAEPTVAARKYKNRPGRKPSRPGQHAVRTEALERLFEQYIDIYITSKLGPWELDVSDELMSEIRRFNSEAIFPSHFPEPEDAKRLASGIVSIDFMPEKPDNQEEIIATLIDVGASSPAFMKLAWEHPQYLGERSGEKKVTPALVKSAVRKPFSLIRGLLEALRNKDIVALDDYRDIAEEQMIAIRKKIALQRKRRNMKLDPGVDEAEELFSSCVQILLNLKWPETVAEKFVREKMMADASVTVEDILHMALKSSVGL